VKYVVFGLLYLLNNTLFIVKAIISSLIYFILEISFILLVCIWLFKLPPLNILLLFTVDRNYTKWNNGTISPFFRFFKDDIGYYVSKTPYHMIWGIHKGHVPNMLSHNEENYRLREIMGKLKKEEKNLGSINI